MFTENARICQELLRRAVTRKGVPDVLYADNGAPFANAWLARTCAVLGIRLVHSKPYSPPLTGQYLDHPPVICRTWTGNLIGAVPGVVGVSP
jgi:transposase InsO family protein